MMQHVGHGLYKLGLPIIRRLLTGSQRVRVLITAGDELLLVKNLISRQKWTLPGGGVKDTESPQVAASRELHEELGLRIKSEQFKLLESFDHAYEPNITWQAVLLHLPLKKRPDLKRRLEIVKAEWVTRHSLPDERDELVDRALGHIKG